MVILQISLLPSIWVSKMAKPFMTAFPGDKDPTPADPERDLPGNVFGFRHCPESSPAPGSRHRRLAGSSDARRTCVPASVQHMTMPALPTSKVRISPMPPCDRYPATILANTAQLVKHVGLPLSRCCQSRETIKTDEAAQSVPSALKLQTGFSTSSMVSVSCTASLISSSPR